MDLIPAPDQIAAAAANLARSLTGGVADLRPVPRTMVADGPGMRVHRHTLPDAGTTGDPVLLLTPPQSSSRCYDLRRGCSLVEHLLAAGHPTYVVEHGDVDPHEVADLAPLVFDAVPEAVRAVSRDAGGRSVHLVGWGAGGLLGLLTASSRTVLPAASLTVLGTPVEPAQDDVRPRRASVLDDAELDGPEGADRAGLVVALARGVRARVPVVGRLLRSPVVDAVVLRRLVALSRLDDADFLAQVEAVARLTPRPPTRAALPHGLALGVVRVGGRRVRLADLALPVLAVAGSADPLAPPTAVRPVAALLTGSPSVRVEVVPGDHLGALTGRPARTTTWSLLVEHLARHPVPPRPLGRRTPRPEGTAGIGTDPARRFSSAASRSLSAVR